MYGSSTRALISKSIKCAESKFQVSLKAEKSMEFCDNSPNISQHAIYFTWKWSSLVSGALVFFGRPLGRGNGFSTGVFVSVLGVSGSGCFLEVLGLRGLVGFCFFSFKAAAISSFSSDNIINSSSGDSYLGPA